MKVIKKNYVIDCFQRYSRVMEIYFNIKIIYREFKIV